MTRSGGDRATQDDVGRMARPQPDGTDTRTTKSVTLFWAFLVIAAAFLIWLAVYAARLHGVPRGGFLLALLA